MQKLLELTISYLVLLTHIFQQMNTTCPRNLTTVTSRHKDIRHNPLMILIHSTVRLNTRKQTVNPTCVSFLSDFLLQHHAKLKTLSIKQHMHNWTELSRGELISRISDKDRPSFSLFTPSDTFYNPTNKGHG